MNNCIIVSNGSFKERKICRDESDFVIAADKGYLNALKVNLKVDLLIGDFDSLKELPKGIETIKLNPIKDDTDTFDAIKIGIQKGYKNFIFYGALGKRIEHSYANISLLLYLKNLGFNGVIKDNKKTITVIKNETIELKKRSGYISIFPLGEKAEGVSLTNLEYELKDYTLRNDIPLGIDNEFINKTASIKVTIGALLLIY